jgi:hypothetical protein
MFFILLTILFSSCHKVEGPSQFINYGLKTTLFTSSVEIIDRDSVNTFKKVSIFGTNAKPLLSLNTYSEGHSIRLCLYAQNKKLFWYEMPQNLRCPNDNKDLVEDLKITSLEANKIQIFYFSQDRRLDSQTLIQKDHVVIKMDESNLSFSLRNLGDKKILPLEVKIASKQYLTDGSLCFQLDDSCNVLKNNCSDCEFGSIPVISSKCDKEYNKICSATSCGNRAAPACVRGYNYSGKNIDKGCSDGVLSGYCQEGLSAYCDERNILVCR